MIRSVALWISVDNPFKDRKRRRSSTLSTAWTNLWTTPAVERDPEVIPGLTLADLERCESSNSAVVYCTRTASSTTSTYTKRAVTKSGRRATDTCHEAPCNQDHELSQNQAVARPRDMRRDMFSCPLCGLEVPWTHIHGIACEWCWRGPYWISRVDPSPPLADLRSPDEHRDEARPRDTRKRRRRSRR